MAGKPHTKEDFISLIGTTHDDMVVDDIVQIVMNNGAKRWQIQCTCKVCKTKRNFLSLNFFKHAGTTHAFCQYNNKQKYDYLIGQIFDDCKIMDVYGKYFGKQGPYWVAVCKCQICNNRKEVFVSELLRPDRHPCHHKRCVYGKYSSRFNRLYYHMKQRCTNTDHIEYELYGGRGIKCEWPDLQSFADDMYDAYLEKANEIGEKNVSLERKDVDKNYNKANCEWIDIKYQWFNKTSTIYFKATSPEGDEFYGYGLNRFCKYYGLNEKVIRSGLFNKSHKCSNGWKIERISKDTYLSHTSDRFGCHGDVPFVIDVLISLYDEFKQKPIHQSATGIITIPKMAVESKMCGYLSQDVIDVIKKFKHTRFIFKYNERKRWFEISEKYRQ